MSEAVFMFSKDSALNHLLEVAARGMEHSAEQGDLLHTEITLESCGIFPKKIK